MIIAYGGLAVFWDVFVDNSHGIVQDALAVPWALFVDNLPGIVQETMAVFWALFIDNLQVIMLFLVYKRVYFLWLYYNFSYIKYVSAS